MENEYMNQYSENSSVETGTNVAESFVATQAVSTSSESQVSNRKLTKQISALTSINKQSSKILKVLGKQIKACEKVESSFCKNKNNEKSNMKDFQSTMAHFKAFKDALREEKYFLENKILENKKMIDQFKDQLAQQKSK